MKFSAEDKDTSDKCAQRSNGAWWYRPGRRCAHSNLNGLYMFGKTNMHWRCVMWYHWKAQTYSLKLAEMKIRPYDIWTSRHPLFASVTDMRTLTWCNWNNKTILIAACKELLMTTNIRWFTVYLRGIAYDKQSTIPHIPTQINVKKLQFIHKLTASDRSKTAKVTKRWYHPPAHRQNVNVLLSNITFLCFLQL